MLNPPELSLPPRPPGTKLTDWLNREIRRAILDGRLGRGVQLPATRSLAREFGVSRGTVVAVFEQLQAEGYLSSRIGSGTRVSERLPEDWLQARQQPSQPPTRQLARPPATPLRPATPFRVNEPALTEFPIELWARVAAKRMRRLPPAVLAPGDIAGYRPLRRAIAEYVGASRGVRCHAEQVLITSGAQQGFDLAARLLIQPGDPVWIEDPAYFGAVAAFRRSGARVVAVPVDRDGLDVARAEALCPVAKAAYITPARQFVLGSAMPAGRRLALLTWARRVGAYVIEDDYDSEYRFTGQPLPALQGLAPEATVYIGSFNKMLYPSLRLGYIVAPEALTDPLLALRFDVDRDPPSLSQAILTDFIAEGHFGRHLRRMRELYARRRAALQEDARRYWAGLLEIPPIPAGLYTAAFLKTGLRSEQAERYAESAGVEAAGLHQFNLERTDLQGLMLGFAAFNEREIRKGVLTLASALETATS